MGVEQMRRAILFASAAYIGLLAFAPARAQTRTMPNGTLEEVVVTARRRSENIEKTPVSVTALSATDLAKKAVHQVLELQQLAPSLQIESNVVAPMGLQISMRGQVQTDVAANSPGSVGTYIDDVFDGGAALAGGLLNLGDLRALEILKGPQGTLYGRNVTAGLVKFETNKPTNDFGGNITVGSGDYGRAYVQGVVNVPLVVDRLALRLVGGYEQHDGYSRDVESNRDLEDLEKASFRGELKIDPTPDLDILLQGWAGTGRNNGGDVRTTYLQPGINAGSLDIMAEEHVNGLTAGALAPLILGAAAGYTPAQIGAAYGAALAALPKVTALVQQYLRDPRGRAHQNPLFSTGSRAQSNGASATVAYRLGSATIRSITAYVDDSRNSTTNVGGGPWVPIYGGQDGSNQQFTEEAQMIGSALDNRLKYAGGVYLLYANLADARPVNPIDGAFPFLLGQLGLGVTNGSASTNAFIDKSAALYGQASYALTDTVHVNLGGRGTSEAIRNTSNIVQLPDIATAGKTVCIGPAPDTSATSLDRCSQSAAISNNNFSFLGGLDWQVTRNILVYAKISRGFKSGGVNAYPTAYQPFSTYQPEIATDYEAGIKSELLDRRLIVNVDFYHTKYSNIQRLVSENIGSGEIVTEIKNAAGATIDGAEFDSRLVVIPGVTLGVVGSYTYPKYSSYTAINSAYPGGQENLSAEPFQGVSRWTLGMSAGYDVNTTWSDIHLELDWAYRSKADLFVDDQFPAAYGDTAFAPVSSTSQGGFSLLNASMVLQFPRYRSTLNVWGKNILDKRYLTSIISLVNNGVGMGFGTYGEPATFGFDYTYHF